MPELLEREAPEWKRRRQQEVPQLKPLEWEAPERKRRRQLEWTRRRRQPLESEPPRQELPEAPERTGGRRWDPPPPPPRGLPAPGRPVRPLFWRVDQRRAAQSQGGAVSPHIAGASRGGAVSPHTAVEAWPHDAVWSPLGWRRPDPPIGLGTYQ